MTAAFDSLSLLIIKKSSAAGLFYNAGREGIEPSSKVLETLILPLNYRPLLITVIITVN